MSLILRRRLLIMERVIIHVHGGNLVLRLNNDKLAFNIHDLVKHHCQALECFVVDEVEEIVQEKFDKILNSNEIYAKLDEKERKDDLTGEKEQ